MHILVLPIGFVISGFVLERGITWFLLLSRRLVVVARKRSRIYKFLFALSTVVVSSISTQSIHHSMPDKSSQIMHQAPRVHSPQTGGRALLSIRSKETRLSLSRS
ncbi:hypothetical protein F5882DRAFT_134643 [Hyaloscypha sp. PMI_1271]|nr:hypothetical protein F5882DRAFT_134643 [Hyaloscypha sp. PMI_1271]